MERKRRNKEETRRGVTKEKGGGRGERKDNN